MTEFPTMMRDTGYVLPGHYSPDEARAKVASWMVREKDLDENEAKALTDNAPVTDGAWWSNVTPAGAEAGAEAGFVMSPDYEGAQAVTVVGLPVQWTNP
jgi:hypothetical protein